jgi:broad specificity phosphatase PhoE
MVAAGVVLLAVLPDVGDGAGGLPGELVWSFRLSSLAVRTRQTADHAGLDEAVGLPALAELDFGAWAGRDPHDVAVAEADALKAWYADADASPPPAGERFGALLARVRVVLSRAAACEGTTIAVTHGGVVKAALAEVLGLAPDVLWRLDLAPASVTELHHSHGAWRVACVNWTPSCGGRS